MNKSFRGNLSVADARIKNERKEEEKEKKEERDKEEKHTGAGE